MSLPTITIVGHDGEFTFTRVEDPGNPIVGSWRVVSQVDDYVVTFLANGTYFVVEVGSADPGHAALERGTYSWNPITGAGSVVVITDTDGISTSFNLTVAVVGNTMTVTDEDNSTDSFSRVIDSFDPLVGGWYTPNAGPTGAAMMLTFTSDGEFYLGVEGDSPLPDEQTGVEHGTYSWNPSTHVFVHTSIVNSAGGWALGSGSNPLFLVTDSTGVVTDGGPGPDSLPGGDGDDTISGFNGNDTLDGGGGNDRLDGGQGNDVLIGGDGNDWLDGGTGADSLTGGRGSDIYVVDDAGDVVVETDGALSARGHSPADPLADSVGTSIDKVISSIDYTLGNLLENLQLAPASAALVGTGNSLANEITGNAANNRLAGMGGNDTIVGAQGIDTATYTGQRSQYAVSRSGDRFTVDGSATGEGTDTLSGVERLQFENGKLALDLEGNAGSVAKILGIVFGSAAAAVPGYVGVGLQLMDGGMSYETLMQLAIDVRLGEGYSHADVVNLLYFNLAQQPTPAAILSLLTAALDTGVYTVTSLGILAADFEGVNAARIDLVGLTAHGIAYV